DDDESSPVDWDRLASAHVRGQLPQHLRANLLGESLPDHMVQFLLLPLSEQPGPREEAAKVLATKYYDPETGKPDLRKTRFFYRGAELLLEQVEAEEARAKAILNAEGALESQSLPSTNEHVESLKQGRIPAMTRARYPPITPADLKRDIPGMEVDDPQNPEVPGVRMINDRPTFLQAAARDAADESYSIHIVVCVGTWKLSEHQLLPLARTPLAATFRCCTCADTTAILQVPWAVHARHSETPTDARKEGAEGRDLAMSGKPGLFSRFSTRKQQVLEIQRGDSAQERFSNSPPLGGPASGDGERDRSSKQLHAHRRESSILSLPSSVTDLGHNVRRSVSLRSHRTQHSTSSIGHRPRYPSSGNLLSKTPPTTSPVASPVEAGQSDTAPEDVDEPTITQRPPRSRGKLSISARSLSQRFKSTDTLGLPSDTPNPRAPPAVQRPPLPVAAGVPPKPTNPMLAQPTLPVRLPPDRPGVVSQASFVRDAHSSHSHSNGAPLQPSASVGTIPSGQNPNTIYRSIFETSQKRMATIDYLRKVHEGNLFYFSTLHYTQSSLQSTLPSMHPHKLGRRATNYLALGYSLPLLLDLNFSSPLEYLKALTALLQEFETYSGLETGGGSLSRAKMGQMFKTGMGLGNRSGMRSGRRTSAATDSIAFDASKAGLLNLPGQAGGDGGSSPLDTSPIHSGHDFHHLLTPHLPFDPDFNTTFATLCDTLIETYDNLLRLIPGPEACTTSVGEVFAKADKAVRKILVANVLREFEDGTRQGVKTEVAGLGRLVLGGLM
ncbi:hypothetical protein LTR53_016284, partial [Teratosphaeriaceae sp. CCFEE 6253]